MDFKDFRCDKDGGLLKSDSNGFFVCETCGTEYLITGSCGYKSNIDKIVKQLIAEADKTKDKK